MFGLEKRKRVYLDYLGNGLCAYNNGTFLLVGTLYGNPEGMKDTLLAWMRQDTANSYASTSDFAKLRDAKGDINIVANMSVLPREATMQMRMGCLLYTSPSPRD